MKPIGEPLILSTKELLNHMIKEFMQQIMHYLNQPHKDYELFHLKIRPMIENDSCCVIFGDLYLENQKLYSGHIGAFTIPDDMEFVEDNIDIEAIWNMHPGIMVSIYPMGSYETKQYDDEIY